MGLTCEVSTSNREDYQLLREEHLRPFGRVRILRDTRLNRYLATKEIHLGDPASLKEYLRAAQLIRESTSRIPTLLKLNGFEEMRRPNCLEHTVQIEFDYVRQNLASDIERRRERLQKFIAEKRRSHDLYQLDRIRLNDYHRINQLSQEDRSYVNLHYLESDILRMIDNMTGSVYYLLRYEYEHGGIRPENIMIDQEGRYLLIDRKLFMLESNYQLGLADHPDRLYMSPQEFKSLRERQQHASKSPELSEIFSVGLIALQMANLNDSIDRIYDFTCWRANVYEMNRLLAQTKQRYSDELTAMLQKMLYFDESDRINLDQLIDFLTPVLQSNLEEEEAVFDRGDKLSVDSSSESSKEVQSNLPNRKKPHQKHQRKPQRNETYNLLARLSEIQESYHRVMSSKVLNEGRFIREQSLRKDEERIINKLRQTQYTNSSSKKPQLQSPQGLSFSHS